MQNVDLEVGHITRNEFVQLGKLGAVEALCLEFDDFFEAARHIDVISVNL